VVGVVAVAGLMVVGSQYLRQARLSAADVVASPSPTPVAQTCISADNCAPPASATCVPGEGVTCASAPAPIPDPSPTPPSSDYTAGTTGPAGQIQTSFVTFSAGGSLNVTVGVLYGKQWVLGAQVSVHCIAAGVDATAAGLTADRSSFPILNGQSPPQNPVALFWTVIPGPGQGVPYTCSGSASYNGLSASFSLSGTG
jgi:hypothetical protein